MQSKVLFFILFSILFTNLNAFSKERCGLGVIKFTYKTKVKIEKEVFCYDEDKNNKFIYSRNCKSLKCKELATPAARPIDLSVYPHSIGSPGFKVCRELGGSPQIIEFKFNSSGWHQSSRCIFSNDTYISNDLLIKLWKPYIFK